jgi:uncharacterized protein YaiL (DUF2058 family)
MGSSLQEQLLKAGLVTEQQARRGKTRGTEAVRREKKNRKAPPAPRLREQRSSPAAVRRAQRKSLAPTDQTAAKHPEQGNKVASPNERKLIRARIKILLRRHRVNDPEAGTPYHFVVGKHIRRIYVTEAQHTLLCQGQLVIIAFGERHYLISEDKLPALQQLEPNLTIITHASANAPDSDVDDLYAGYRVPDDLIW